MRRTLSATTQSLLIYVGRSRFRIATCAQISSKYTAQAGRLARLTLIHRITKVAIRTCGYTLLISKEVSGLGARVKAAKRAIRKRPFTLLTIVKTVLLHSKLGGALIYAPPATRLYIDTEKVITERSFEWVPKSFLKQDQEFR